MTSNDKLALPDLEGGGGAPPPLDPNRLIPDAAEGANRSAADLEAVFDFRRQRIQELMA